MKRSLLAARLSVCESCFRSLESKNHMEALKKKKKAQQNTHAHNNFSWVDPDNNITCTQWKCRLFSTAFLCISLSLTHTHAQYSTRHTERAAGGFIGEMVLILLSVLTNRHLAPWNIWFASCQSCFPHIARMKPEIMSALGLFSKQRRESLLASVHILYMLWVNYCICPCDWLIGKNWCDTWWHICASCAWKIKLPSVWCSVHVCPTCVFSACLWVWECVLLLSVALQPACILMFHRSDNRISQDIYPVTF